MSLLLLFPQNLTAAIGATSAIRVGVAEASTALEQFSAASALFIRPQVHATGSETFGATLTPRVPVLLQGYAEEGYTARLPWLMPNLKTAAIGDESFAAFATAAFHPRALAYAFLHIDQPIVARSNDYQTTTVSATVNYTTRVLGSDWVTTRVNVRVYQ